MPFVLIIAGIVLLVAAVRNTQQCLFFLLGHDFTGQNNFIYWFLSILIIGAIGYIPKAKPISDGFLILVILTLILKEKSGFFDMFQKQISQTQTSSPTVSSGSGTTGAVNFVPGGGASRVGINVGGIGISF